MNPFTKVWSWIVPIDKQDEVIVDRLVSKATDQERPLGTQYKRCTNCRSLTNKKWLYDHCWACCKTVDSWSPESLAAACCEVEWKDGPQIGDVVSVSCTNPLMEYGQPWRSKLFIDISWRPTSWHLQSNVKPTSTIVHNGDKLTILSRPMEVYECPYLIFKVRDKANNSFYLSAQYLTGN